MATKAVYYPEQRLALTLEDYRVYTEYIKVIINSISQYELQTELQFWRWMLTYACLYSVHICATCIEGYVGCLSIE